MPEQKSIVDYLAKGGLASTAPSRGIASPALTTSPFTSRHDKGSTKKKAVDPTRTDRLCTGLEVTGLVNDGLVCWLNAFYQQWQSQKQIEIALTNDYIIGLQRIT